VSLTIAKQKLTEIYPSILGVGTLLPIGSQECVDPTSLNIGYIGDHRSIALFSEFGYLAAFSYAGGSELSDVKNDAKFRTF